MYRDFKMAWRGLGKNLYAAFDYRSVLLVLAWLWLAVVAWVPILTLGLAAIEGTVGELSILLAGLAIGLMLTLWLIALWSMGQSPALALLYPALITMGSLVSLQSLLMTRTGRATWKGRRLARTGKSVESVR
jgi:chlorobactene glucosyltransferase